MARPRKNDGGRSPAEIGRDAAERAAYDRGTLDVHRYVMTTGGGSNRTLCASCKRPADALIHAPAVKPEPSGRRAEGRQTLAGIPRRLRSGDMR